MELVSSRKILKDAVKGNYAIAAFNVHNMETLKAVIKGAVEMDTPVIIQTSQSTVKYAGIEYLVALVGTAAKLSSVPVVLHLDHCTDWELAKKCIDAGYTSIMVDGSMLSYEENVALVKKAVEYAHLRDVTVEAELGRVAGVEDDLSVEEEKSLYTDPDLAVDFVEKTGVDSLAIAIGTAHGVYKGEPKLDYDRLNIIRNKVDVPLVLHGASCVPDESIIKAVELGINKINIATELKMPFADAIKRVFKEKPQEDDPRKYFTPAMEAVTEVVKHKIGLCSSAGKASLYR